jgi:hypothetical protein
MKLIFFSVVVFSVIGLAIPSFVQSITADHLESNTKLPKHNNRKENQFHNILR